MERLNTLSGLLETAGCRFRVFELGRQVAKMDSKQFLRFERCQVPWALPLRQHAWFALAFWRGEQQSEPFVWFLHLPLDEQGLLMPVARDHFLQQVITVLGINLVSQQDAGQETLSKNPFIRKPDQNRLALFHSLLRQELKLAPSSHYAQAHQWLDEPQSCDWQALGVQGIADLLVRLQGAEQPKLASRLAELPDEALQLLLPLLEFRPLPVGVEPVLVERLHRAMAVGDRPTLLACLRALGQGDAKEAGEIVADLLSGQLRQDVEFLATVAARLWPGLRDNAELRVDYLRALAEHDQHTTLFGPMIKELMGLQPLRPALQKTLRSPTLPTSVQGAMVGLTGQTLH